MGMECYRLGGWMADDLSLTFLSVWGKLEANCYDIRIDQDFK